MQQAHNANAYSVPLASIYLYNVSGVGTAQSVHLLLLYHNGQSTALSPRNLQRKL
jgi:hypothetical protein